jgi:hypothetical protein
MANTRKTVRPAKQKPKAAKTSRTGQPKSKLDKIAAALRSAKGATISDLAALTGWQKHSVRGALAGALKKRGFRIENTVSEGVRTYRITAPK